MVTVTVIGSVNLDIVAEAARLPAPGETVTDAELHRFPGGKGANQALAACRSGSSGQKRSWHLSPQILRRRMVDKLLREVLHHAWSGRAGSRNLESPRAYRPGR
jgi:hypothetical protein